MDYGSSYLPSELNAAYLYAQLEQHKKISDKRMQIYDFYNENLKFLAEEGKIEQPYVPKECTHNAHMYYIKVHDIKVRTRLLKYLRSGNLQRVPLCTPSFRTRRRDSEDFPGRMFIQQKKANG